MKLINHNGLVLILALLACSTGATGFIVKKIIKLSLLGKIPRYYGRYANSYGYGPFYGPRPIFSNFAGGGIRRPFPVPQPYPVPVPVSQPVPVPVSRPYPVPVDRPVPIPFQVPVPVRIPQPIPVPEPVIIRRPVPVFIGGNNGGVYGEGYGGYGQFFNDE